MSITTTGTAASVSTGQASVGTTATALTGTSAGSQAIVKAPATNTQTIYVGGSGVTTATGYPLEPGASVPLPLRAVAIYAVAAATGQKVAWIEQVAPTY
ncbi:hypothetical protein DYQ86_16140 [Acidobacteria bacterium AB60]|nr:hypothetical protein DYQ86_16140 [Acidobacteria bacterium AB60]